MQGQMMEGVSMMNDSAIGVVILNYNTYQETVDCVRSIKNHTKGNYKIYIVDNNSTDCSGNKLKKKYDCEQNIEVIINKENRGYSAGNNIGIKKAILDEKDVVFIVNSDVELLNDAFSQMIQTLLSNDEFMMVGPSVINNKGKESQLPRKKLDFKTFIIERHPFCDIPFFKKRANRKYPMNTREAFAFKGSVAGCCFGMRAEDFIGIDFLDENVFLYYEEDILAYKMEERNKMAVVDRKAKVWHKENISTNKRGNAFVQFHRWTSVLYMFKHYAKLGVVGQIFIAVWNTVTWLALSIFSKKYRRLLGVFWKNNWGIVFQK